MPILNLRLPTSGDSSSSSQSKTITIPNLGKIKNITADTGNVTYELINSQQVKINISGGNYVRRVYDSKKYSKYVAAQTSSNYNSNGYTGTLSRYLYSGSYTPSHSKTVTDSRTSSTNNFPSSISYDSGGYSGTLSKSGPTSSKVISGSPGDSKAVNMGTYYYEFMRKKVTKINKPGDYDWTSIDETYQWGDPDWSHVYGCNGRETTRNIFYGNTFTYKDSYGYTGTLEETHFDKEHTDYYDWPEYPSKGDIFKTRKYTYEIVYQGTVTKPDTRVYEYTQNYSGTVTKPAKDTRVYRYKGTVYKGGYNYYYAYNITIEYQEDSKTYFKINNEYKKGHFYLKQNGIYVKAAPYLKVNNEYKRI